MTSLNEQLRLEILATTSGNLIANHSAQGGVTTGWSIISGEIQTNGFYNNPAATVNAATGLAYGYNGKSLRLRNPDGGLGFPGWAGVRGPAFPVAGLQFANFAVTLNTGAATWAGGISVYLGIEWLNGAGAVIGRAMDRDYRNIPLGESTIDLGSNPRLASETGKTVTLQAPSGTATARPFISYTLGGGTGPTPTFADLWIFKTMVVAGTTAASVAGPVFSDVPETWQNLLPQAIRANVTRGGDVDGVTDNLDAGLMVASIKDPQVTPDNNDRVRPGRPIRLLALNGSTWESVFRGKIVQASTSYAGEVPVVSITATDGMADLENFAQPLGKSGTFKQRVLSALLNVPGLPAVVTDAAANVTQATISADDNGTALSQLRAVRDSLRGLFYVDRTNTLRAFAQASYPSQAPTVLFSDQASDAAAIHYTGIETNFDSKNLVNTLLVSKTALSEADGTKVYGPYVNQASVDAWGPVSATLEINDGTPATLAAAYLAVYAQPKIFTDSVTFNATDNIAQAVVRDLYEAARVKFAKAGVDAVYRIIGIEHEITAEAWITTVRFKPLEATSTITVTNPPGGAATGPADLVPFTREIQTGMATVTLTTTPSKTLAVTFPKPYETAPRVFLTLRTGGATTPVMVLTAISPTTTGFTIAMATADQSNSTAARDVQWIAVPA